MDVLEASVYIILFYIGYKILHSLLKIPQISDIQSRYILVTGCDTGFGNAIVKRLDGMGCHVIAACLTEEGEAELKKACSHKLHTVHMDVSNPESVKKAFEQVKKILPHKQGLWGLVNNAGITGNLGPADWLAVEDYKHCLSVNTFGLIDVAMTFLPLIKAERGRIVNMASMAGRASSGASAPYHVSKYGVEAFSDGLRRDLRPFGVSVSVIEPLFYKTNIGNADNLKKTLQNTFDQLPNEIKNQYGEEFIESSLERISNIPIETDISPVLDAYTHALLGLFPSARYPLGKGVTFFLFIHSLPEWMGDRLVERILKQTKPAGLK